MSTYIDLDSIFRDRQIWPNPADYEIFPKQIKSWFPSSRSVTNIPQNPNLRPLEFVTSVKINSIVLPYDASVADTPRIYVDFHSTRYNDTRLISTVDNVHGSARFICTFDKLQNDGGGAPIWMHYTCDMEQQLRFDRQYPVRFTVRRKDGTLFPNFDALFPAAPTPNRQILATFELTPYIRDGDYRNNMLETLTT